MARNMKQGSSAKAPSEISTRNKMTAKELQEWYDANQKHLQNFEAAQSAATLLKDITKNSTKSISTFSKETLRTYMTNLGSNENNLRNLSWFLFYRSMTYMRVCCFYPNILELGYRSLIPEYEFESPDPEGMQSSLIETDTILNLWHIKKVFRDAALISLVQDVFYGIWIEDDTGLFIWQVPAQYAKICGQYHTGDFSFAMDMSYIRSHQELLEYMPEPLNSMYNEYMSTNQKWVLVPDEYSICLKFRCEDYETILPPLLPSFYELINLADLQDTQATADKLSIFKLIWLEMETLNKADSSDEWKVDPEIMVEYYNKMISEAFPEYVTGAIVPGKLNSISFDDQADKDVNKVMKATQTVLNSMGSAEVLNGATITGAEAFRTAQIVSSNFVLKPLLPQIEAIINRHLSYSIGTPSKVVFHEVTSLTRQYFDEKVLASAQNGVPCKLLLGSTLGYSVKDTLSMNFLEEQVLGITDAFRPLQTSYTQSGDDGGRPKESGSDTGDESAEKRDKANQ